jgi:pSer/pThr/pTyr-binding forkhead associated (FHA) protein
MWVGRDEACVIRLDDRQISRKHALLRSTDKGVEFEKKSKFGWIKLNGTETTQAMLRDGDRLELGSFEIRVSGSANQAKPEVIEPSHTVKLNPEVLTQLPAELLELNPPASEADVPVEEAPAEPVSENGGMNFDFSTPSVESNASNAFDDPPQSTSSIDPAAVSNDGATRIFNAPGKIKAILQFGEGAANVDQYEIGDQEIAIGRSQQCHVVLEDKRSSRKHALIKRDGLRFMLKDLGSANGTLVNGLRVDEHELQSGDQLQIGDTIFTFQQLQADYEAKKDEFIQVPQHEAAAVATPIHTDLASSMSHLPSYAPDPFSNEPLQTPLHNEPIQPSFGNPEPEKKKSIIGKFLDRYRAMNT